jgi:pilus assembly protein CpaC
MTNIPAIKQVFLALTLGLLALPLAAQAPDPPQVVFQVQIVQAGPGAGNALAAERAQQAVDFQRDDQMSVHILRENAPLDAIVAAQRNRNDLDIVSLPKMTTTAGLEAHFVIGGRYPVPTVDDPAAPAGQSRDSNGAGRGGTAPRSEFGLRLSLRPTPLPNGMLRVRVTPRVQTVDFGRSTTRDGQFVPAIVTRQTNRVVDLQPGQSFAITGVLNDEVVRQLQKVPELNNQRLMQALLNARTRRPGSNLVVLVTPQVIPQPAAD